MLRVLETSWMPGENTKPQRNVYERRAYAAHRVAIATERLSRAVAGPPSERARALGWMKLWVAFVLDRSK